jgi:hypothetical protein
MRHPDSFDSKSKTGSHLQTITPQNTLGDELVTREMRAFCELCQKEYLVSLIYMKKGELITLSQDCKEAVNQCEFY